MPVEFKVAGSNPGVVASTPGPPFLTLLVEGLVSDLISREPRIAIEPT